jgi:hypothetical protein
MLHGHWDTAPVLKVQLYGPLIGVPEAFCAPDTVAVSVVPDSSGPPGVKVATVSASLKETDPATADPPESCNSNDTVPGATGWENVTVGATDTGLADEPAVGVTAVIVGGVLPESGEYTTSTQ